MCELIILDSGTVPYGEYVPRVFHFEVIVSQ